MGNRPLSVLLAAAAAACSVKQPEAHGPAAVAPTTASAATTVAAATTAAAAAPVTTAAPVDIFSQTGAKERPTDEGGVSDPVDITGVIESGPPGIRGAVVKGPGLRCRDLKAELVGENGYHDVARIDSGDFFFFATPAGAYVVRIYDEKGAVVSKTASFKVTDTAGATLADLVIDCPYFEVVLLDANGAVAGPEAVHTSSIRLRVLTSEPIATLDLQMATMARPAQSIPFAAEFDYKIDATLDHLQTGGGLGFDLRITGITPGKRYEASVVREWVPAAAP